MGHLIMVPKSKKYSKKMTGIYQNDTGTNEKTELTGKIETDSLRAG